MLSKHEAMTLQDSGMNIVIPMTEGLEVHGYLVARSEERYTAQDLESVTGLAEGLDDTNHAVKAMRSDYLLTIVKKIK